MNKISLALKKLFEKHRIVFWYDSKKELRHEYEQLELAEIAKIELQNNEFKVKYRILREEPHQKFLLYHAGAPPADMDNWLLDVQLASGEFSADQAAIYLSELGLGIEFIDIIKKHADFFNSVQRRDKLNKLLSSDDTQNAVRIKMLAVCASSDPREDAILESLLGELALKKSAKFKLIQRCGLESFLWKRLQICYAYQSDTPGILDFTIELFKSCYAMSSGNPSQLNADALVFLKRWKNNIRLQNAFETLSEQCADILNIEKELENRDSASLEEIDYFEVIDKKILNDLVNRVVNRTIPASERENLIRQRKQSHWYAKYRHLYKAADYGARFIRALQEAELGIESVHDGIVKYTKNWFRIDQLYRKYRFHACQSGQVSILGALSEMLENLYSNNYLLDVNNNWQKIIDQRDKWGVFNINMQRHFFKKQVRPFLNNKKKVFVIISDGLRFEAGEELHRLIRQEDRFDALLEPMLAMLPSFTQLGMASLLPNREIKFADNDTGIVLADGQSSQGTANRSKILNNAVKGRAKAMRAEELMGMNKNQCRNLFREHDVVYIYHNRIDAAGDKKESEERVFDAVEETFAELIKIIKKLTGANASNLLVTSDHGFIYQHRPIDESDFLGNEVTHAGVSLRDRRFLVGKNLPENPGMKKFTAAQAGIQGDMEIQIPKSVNRMRLQGSGSRYVHGGASFQEVIIPVIKINKKRKSDISQVDVNILGSSTSQITTGQLSAAFYQTHPVTDKVRARTLRAGIYSKDDELLSDSHTLSFDFTSEHPREREIRVRFVLTSRADDLNEQEVFLRLEELISGTSHYQEYQSARYLIRRSFTSDFDL
ncbi:BREX-1 system phosphatase PglZ type A [Desulfococcaceae bacterium HSG7]|nr:BREX-1 system phosphatase PglZ type A [Desulfococcaceae bacterium HSG7]